jgi:hypothetical protein
MNPEAPGELVEMAGDAVVIRFRPTQPESVWNQACKEHRRIGRYRLSVFADVRRPDETEDGVIGRLLKASEVGINPEKNKKFTVCTSSAELLDLGFTFWKDGDDDNERDEHYSVDLGVEAKQEDVDRFLAVFGPAEERR